MSEATAEDVPRWAQALTDEHVLPLEALGKAFNTRVNAKHPLKSPGLLDEEANEIRAAAGLNELSPPKDLPEIVKYLLEFKNFFMILLLAAGVLSFIAYGLQPEDPLNLYLACVLIFIVFLNTLISSVNPHAHVESLMPCHIPAAPPFRRYLQSRAAANVMARFRNMLSLRSLVIRDGVETEIDSKMLVPGDIVHVKMGNRVPADLRIIYANEFVIETSSLTGESEPIRCTPEVTNKLDDPPTEAKNLAFNSNLCLGGEAYGVVVRTGDNSLIGRIANLASSQKKKATLLEREVQRFVYIISGLAVGLGAIFFTIGMAQGKEFVPTFVNGFIIVIVANVPQGLPATVTSVLTITANRMGKKNIFVRRMDAVESLGAASIVASDKTGTLTQNKMTVAHVWSGHTFSGDEVLRQPDETILHTRNFRRLFLVAALCNRANFSGEEVAAESTSVQGNVPEDNVPPAKYDVLRSSAQFMRELPAPKYRPEGTTVEGDASESAIFTFCEHIRSVQSLRKMFPKVFEIPFNSKNKWQLSIHKVKAAWLLDEEIADAADDEATKDEATKDETTKDEAKKKSKSDKEKKDRKKKESEKKKHQEKKKEHEKKQEQEKKEPLMKKETRSKKEKHVEGQVEGRRLVIKGAAERILSMCSHHVIEGRRVKIDDKFQKQVEQMVETFGVLGERVLGFAECPLDPKEFGPEFDTKIDSSTVPLEGYTFVGLITLYDPPREGVDKAIADLKSAGIRVMMVTGDHPVTAKAIAQQVGIITEVARRDSSKLIDGEEDVEEVLVPVEPPDYEVVTGAALKTFKEEDWDRLLAKKEIVFARTTPEQKLDIVKNCQRLGHVIAMTGDGVNDSPALRAADIGVAMGKNGSDVAREASAIVLTDDNFASIVIAVREGRIVFDNLKKTVAYTLAHLGPEILPVLLNLGIGFPLGLSSLQILSIDLGTELAPAISLSYESGEGDIMRRPPRNIKTDRLVSFPLLAYSYLISGMVINATCLMVYFLVYDSYDIRPSDLFQITTNHFKTNGDNYTTWSDVTYNSSEQQAIQYEAATGWYVTLILAQVGHIWMCKTRTRSLFQHDARNLVMVYGIIIELALMVIFVFVPFIQPVFGTANLPGIYWPSFLAAVVFLWVYNEGRKAWTRKWKDGIAAKLLAW